MFCDAFKATNIYVKISKNKQDYHTIPHSVSSYKNAKKKKKKKKS